jgi:hypothetical protein
VALNTKNQSINHEKIINLNSTTGATSCVPWRLKTSASLVNYIYITNTVFVCSVKVRNSCVTSQLHRHHWYCTRVCKLQKECTRLAAASDKVYQLLAHGRWFSPGTPVSSTTNTGRHDIASLFMTDHRILTWVKRRISLVLQELLIWSVFFLCVLCSWRWLILSFLCTVMWTKKLYNFGSCDLNFNNRNSRFNSFNASNNPC